MEKDTLGFGKKKKRKRFPKRMKNHSDIGVLCSYSGLKKSKKNVIILRCGLFDVFLQIKC